VGCWPKITALPADYGGDPAIRQETMRSWLDEAKGDDRLAMKLLYACLVKQYRDNDDKFGVREVDAMLWGMVQGEQKQKK
jgi:hypothetical protein